MKKGFTLVELLAVILILAILALIASPIITGVIESAKKASAERSMESYVKSVEMAQVKYQSNGKTTMNLNDLDIDYSGKKVIDPVVEFDEYGEIDSATAYITDYYCVYFNGQQATCSKLDEPVTVTTPEDVTIEDPGDGVVTTVPARSYVAVPSAIIDEYKANINDSSVSDECIQYYNTYTDLNSSYCESAKAGKTDDEIEELTKKMKEVYVRNTYFEQVKAESSKFMLSDECLMDYIVNDGEKYTGACYQYMSSKNSIALDWIIVGAAAPYKAAVETGTYMGVALDITTINSITFYSDNRTISGYSAVYDISSDKSNTYKMYVVLNNGLKDISFVGNGKIKLNADSSYMFAKMANLTSVNFNNSVDASNVVSMKGMFQNAGNNTMTSLNLTGLDTSNVKDMSYMFSYTGYYQLINLNLGSTFNTSNVTNMYHMFEYTGFAKLASLSLGNNFITTNVTEMGYMFFYTGASSMISLNLGNGFTNIPVTGQTMFQNVGKSNCIISVPEELYIDSTHVKINGNTSSKVTISGDSFVKIQ